MPDETRSDQLHGTAVAIDGRGVLLLGRPGAGKSDIALRLIDRGAGLIADDRVDLVREGTRIMLSAPHRIAGLLEVRGIGIVRLTPLARVPLALSVRLVERAVIERMPEGTTQPFLGLSIAQVRVDPFEPSAAIKVEWALRHARIALDAAS